MVGTNVVTCYWTCSLSLLVIGWTILGNWFPTKCGVYVGGTTCCLGTGYSYLNT
jgi:hypothetical protein